MAVISLYEGQPLRRPLGPQRYRSVEAPGRSGHRELSRARLRPGRRRRPNSRDACYEEPQLQDRPRKLVALLEEAGDGLFALLYRLTLRHDAADDLLQELFLRLSQSEGFFQAADSRAFAARVAINLALDWRRRRARRPQPVSLPPEQASEQVSPLARLIEAEEHEALLDALSRLPRLSSQAFVLRFLELEPYAEVGRKLDRTPHQARALCHKAVQRLRSLLAPRMDSGRKEIRHAKP